MNGKDEEGNDDDRPGDHEDGDLNEILEERDIAHQLAGGCKDRRAGVEAHLRDAARMQKKFGGRQAGASGLQAKTRKTVKNDFGEAVEIADEEGEEAEKRVFLMRRAMTSASPASAQKRPASVMSRAISVCDRNLDIAAEEAEAAASI